jgi:hypothetical protein
LQIPRGGVADFVAGVPPTPLPCWPSLLRVIASSSREPSMALSATCSTMPRRCGARRARSASNLGLLTCTCIKLRGRRCVGGRWV